MTNPKPTPLHNDLDDLRSKINEIADKYYELSYEELKKQILSFEGEGVELVAAILALKKDLEEHREYVSTIVISNDLKDKDAR